MISILVVTATDLAAFQKQFAYTEETESSLLRRKMSVKRTSAAKRRRPQALAVARLSNPAASCPNKLSNDFIVHFDVFRAFALFRLAAPHLPEICISSHDVSGPAPMHNILSAIYLFIFISSSSSAIRSVPLQPSFWISHARIGWVKSDCEFLMLFLSKLKRERECACVYRIHLEST